VGEEAVVRWRPTDWPACLGAALIVLAFVTADPPERRGAPPVELTANLRAVLATFEVALARAGRK
jgi:hypothetical protein